MFNNGKANLEGVNVDSKRLLSQSFHHLKIHCLKPLLEESYNMEIVKW
jgi:hypothetical protein